MLNLVPVTSYEWILGVLPDPKPSCSKKRTMSCTTNLKPSPPW
jgi:hypothetical protein